VGNFLPPPVVFRAIRTKKWIAGNSVTRDAYFLRPAETGLSVATSKQVAIDIVPGNKGVARISVEGIRSVVDPTTGSKPLDVVLDTEEHGNIIGMPRLEENLEAAESMAFDLAGMSLLC
jgi:hypothetical protein